MNRDVEAKLRLCPTLPTLSGVAMRIVTIARDPNVDLSEVTALLANDPALAAKTLRVANSSLYGRARRAQNLRQAVAVLGLNATITLTLSFSLAACLREVDGARLDHDCYWRRALLSGVAARVVGEHAGLRSLDELFLGGLLQDIGVWALDAIYPEEYAKLTAEATSHDALIAIERGALGVDHREAGAWLMREWGLPEYLCMATLSSHALDRSGLPADLAPFLGCVAASGRVAEIYRAADTQAATTLALNAVEGCLEWTPAALDAVLAQMAEALPEVEPFFEVSVLSPAQAAGLTDQARELLTSRNLQLLRSAAEMRTKEAEFERLAERLQDVARRDELTGVFNRRHFNETLVTEIAQAKAEAWPVSLAYLDIDHFKSVNDRYGHLAGDQILTRTVQYMQSLLRRDDLLARYGGEEFVLLMPGVGHEIAQKVVNRLRAAVAVLDNPLDSGETVRVTISAGVADYVPGGQAAQAPNALLTAADRALYSAKRQGRNRVVVAAD